MAGEIYKKPVAFAVLALVVILVGTVMTMAYPMLRPEMHPRLQALKAFSPLELAGRDVYQREGCSNCHTQTVRPLQSEVVRYKGNRAQEVSGRYSLAGEFAFDHPFLWGSKRTGPDLAFEGWLKNEKWQYAHFADPQAVVPRSNMPRYAFLSGRKLDPAEVKAHYRALASLHPADFKATDADFQALAGKTDMDALVAYMMVLGKAVNRGGGGAGGVDLEAPNPFAGDKAAIVRGQKLFGDSACGACHGDAAEGVPGVAPSLVDAEFAGEKPDLPDAAYFALIKYGSEAKKALGRPGIPDGGMQAFGSDLSDDDIWSIVAWMRSKHAEAAPEKKP